MLPTSGLDYLRPEFQQATQIFKRLTSQHAGRCTSSPSTRESKTSSVADVSARRREMQFVLAIGFVNGQIGANSLTRYSRDLQTQIETISLNRTIVGFSHNDDTFGWRFQPRVQARARFPARWARSAKRFAGLLRDYDLRHRQLEAGERECTAIVLMPSFVPYADFDIRTNWYALTNPWNAVLTMKDSVHLSRAVTAMRNSRAMCSQVPMYRDNEVGRLLKRVDQLDHELPLQTMRTLVPYENTLGGFEMFNTGVTDLAPELIGWYGVPGIRIADDSGEHFKCGCTSSCVNGSRSSIAGPVTYPDANGKPQVIMTKDAFGNPIPVIALNDLPICEGDGTTVFLVGDNFSIHYLKVIAGGVCMPSVQLVSRSIMRVTIPSRAQTVVLCENGKSNEYVALYVATPYGVTNHLHIPVYRGPLTPAAKDQIKQAVDDVIKGVQATAGRNIRRGGERQRQGREGYGHVR